MQSELLLPPVRRDPPVIQWNETGANDDLTLRIDRRIAAVAALHPHRSAIDCGGHSITYAALERKTQAIAEHLHRHQIGPNDRVGIYLGRTPELIPTLLAVIRCGAAYVPLDPSFPLARLAFMAQDAQLSAVIAQRALPSLPMNSARTLFVEDVGTEVSGLPFGEHSPDSPAYILYTSGSTGQPKGVVIPHRAFNNFVCSMLREPGLSDSDRVLAVTTLSFDIAVLELLVPLTAGARITVAQREQAIDGAALSRLIEEHRINWMQATPTTWHLLLDAGWQAPPDFRALCGGEAMPAALARRLLAQGVELWNLYGPTETTVWSTLQPVRSADVPISVGKPIANTAIYILDDQQRPCAVGEIGEIYIGGVGVALGYWQRPDLTEVRFVADPYSPEPQARMYRTGDLGRWLDDGTVEHLGRMDHQVKIRGYRIELGEIEARLTQVTGITRALVSARDSGASGPELVAYVIADRNYAVDSLHLRTVLARDLPDYMVPGHFIELAAFPLLPNGKVDRNALPAPIAAAPAEASTKLVSATERQLAAIWHTLLNVSSVEAQHNFFQIGGHSLLAVRMLAAVERDLHVNVPLSILLKHPTCAALAAYIDSERSPSPPAWQPLVSIKPGNSTAPLFCIHAVGGNVLNYRVLADALPSDQAVYGLQAIGLDGVTEPLHTLEDMARRYIEEIRTVQPVGPYYLCGGSMGGTIAFEMARQLDNAGQQVAFLALMDTWGPGLRRRTSSSKSSLWRRTWDALVGGRFIRRLRSRLDRRELQRALAHSRATRHALPQDLRWRHVTACNEAALSRYREQRYSGDMVLLCAHATQARGLADLGWSDVVSGTIEVVALPGEHNTFVEEPAVGEALCLALERAQQAWNLADRRLVTAGQRG